MVNHRRGPWSQAEDLFLLQLVQRDGASNWVRISHAIQTRSPKQCRERYHQNLKPSLNHDPITPEEGEQIEKMVNEMGKRWAEIARRLKGRSDNAVKNWWNGGQNRRRRGHEHRREDRDQSYRMESEMSSISSSSYERRFVGEQDQDRDHYRRRSEGYLHKPHDIASFTPPQESSPQFQQPSTALSSLFSSRPSHYQSNGRPTALNLSLPSHSGRPHVFDTPMPSPAASVISADGAPPSLITDNGSESRSPQYSASPRETAYTLPPAIGSRDERRRSSVRYIPKTGFAPEDDDFKPVMLAPISKSHSSEGRVPIGPIRLPSPQCLVEGAPALPSPRELISGTPVDRPMFREPNYSLPRLSPGSTLLSRSPVEEPRKMALSSILA
jgi:Myb-like DNA-binding protein FlbD